MSAGIRNAILETYPDIADYLDAFLPKKDQFKVVKCHDHVELLINSSGDLLFWRWVNIVCCMSMFYSAEAIVGVVVIANPSNLV